MLEIDYNLFPLSEEERNQIGVRARLLARRGKPPPLTPASFGRIVVVNPDDNITLHHVPDDLRRPLRRALLPVYEGSKAVSGAKLSQDILEKSSEPIYGIVVELNSRFPEAVSFLGEIPRIQFQHPKCHLMLHGELIRVHDLLGEVLSHPQASCDLLFSHVDEPLTLNAVDQLEKLMLEPPRYPTLQKPFFSALSIRDQNDTELYEFRDFGKLYRVFGVGNIDELDLSGKMKVKLVVLDIPMSAIQFIRLGKPDGSFHALNLDGEIIPASELEAKELVGRDIPFHYLKSIYRKLPGKPQEEIPMDQVRALRVNCFDGHVSFMWKPGPDFMPLYEVNEMRLNMAGENGAPSSTVKIDRAIITQRGQPKFGEVRAGIRHPFLEHIFRETLGRQVKLQHYAAKLKIACLGPMAAQTLNLLRAHGLAQLIPQESLYYLCDSYDQIPVYYESQERAQKLYDEVVSLIRGVFGPEQAGKFGPDLINHRLPLLQDWARGEVPALEEVNAEHLDTVYKEMRVFLNFTDSEFRRVGEADNAGENFLVRVEKCQKALLTARHLGNLVGGRYGQLPNRRSFPDFVFFGSEDEVNRNRREYYLPGLALSGIFSSGNIRKMMQSQDFEFSVFLGEQLSLISYLKSQEPEIESDQQFYDNYFDEKLMEAERDLEQMQRTKEVAVNPDSEYFKSAVDRYTELHHAEMQAFRTDREEEARKLEDQEARYFEALKEVNDYLEEIGADPQELLSSNNYIRALDQYLIRISKEMGDKFKELVRENLQNVSRFIADKKKALTDYLMAFSTLQKTLFQELQAGYGTGLNARINEDMNKLLERMHTIAGTADGDLETVRSNLEKRQRLALENFSAAEAKISGEIAKNQNTMLALREANRNLVTELSKPIGESSGAHRRILEAVEDRLEYGKVQIIKVAGAAQASYQTVQSLRASYRSKTENALELYFGQNELAMLNDRKGRSRMQRMMAAKPAAPLVPLPPMEDAGNPQSLAGELEACLGVWREAGKRVVDFSRRDKNLADMRKGMERFDTFQRIFRNFRSAVRNKTSSQQFLSGLTNRLGELNRESKNITEVVIKSILPARATYADRIHIPNIRKRMAYLRQARVFLKELNSQSYESLQREFLDRGIFRRFHASQFRSGALVGMNTEMPIFAKLTNVTDGISAFHRVLRANLVSNGYASSQIDMARLPAERLGAVLKFIEMQKQTDPDRRHDYIILPSTFTLSQALEVIQFKEELFNGLPQLLLIYVSKFDVSQLRDDEELRERYFMAMKHNIIINIDDDRVIDNPKAIADHLLQQTLGCAHDIDVIEAAAGAVTDHSRGGDDILSGISGSGQG